MGCANSKKPGAATQLELEAKGNSGQGRGSPAKDHLPSHTLPENPAAGGSGPPGATSKAIGDPRARLQAYVDSHPVVIFSKSTCRRCAEVKKLFNSMHVPYLLLELDRAVPCIEGGACIIMPVDGYWLCLPASHVRPFVQPVRVMQPCPHCCWFPGARPSVPAPSCVPALLPRGSHSVALPAPPSSSAPPFTSQASCSTDRRLCPSSPTADGRQEKKVILNIPPKLFKATMKYN
ncbi:uncharacterized protein RBU33_023565 [Hipposideros larvatus]